MDPGEFEGLHVVVTGGTGALGSAVVGMLLGRGARCHVPARSERSAEGRPWRGRDGVTVAAGVDLADERSVRTFFDGLPSLWASIHCAGGFDAAEVVSTSFDAYRRIMATNADAAFLSCREAVRAMRARNGGRGGRIVNVAARPAVEPRTGAGMTAYAASKGAVVVLTQALAEEVAREGIWVNAVAPGILDTPANRDAMPDADHARWPRLDEVAETILFLASARNRSTRGAIVPVYGRS